MSVAVTGERTQSETLSSASSRLARPCWEACQGGLYLKCNAVMKSPAKAIHMLHCICTVIEL